MAEKKTTTDLAEVAAPPQLFTVTEHAERRGLTGTDDDGDPAYHWTHAVAATVHRWNEHHYHAGTELRLSDADYEAALAAAATYPATQPHLAALCEA